MQKSLKIFFSILAITFAFNLISVSYSAEIQSNVTKTSRGFTVHLNELLDSYVKPNALNTSTDMITGALTGKGISEKAKKILEIKTQRSEELQTEIDKAIQTNNNTEFSNYKSYLSYKTGDLGLSVGKATLVLSGAKLENNLWTIDVKINDVYNFDEIRNNDSMGSILNNMGYLLENSGNLTPYDWEINYTFTYKVK